MNFPQPPIQTQFQPQAEPTSTSNNEISDKDFASLIEMLESQAQAETSTASSSSSIPTTTIQMDPPAPAPTQTQTSSIKGNGMQNIAAGQQEKKLPSVMMGGQGMDAYASTSSMGTMQVMFSQQQQQQQQPQPTPSQNLSSVPDVLNQVSSSPISNTLYARMISPIQISEYTTPLYSILNAIVTLGGFARIQSLGLWSQIPYIIQKPPTCRPIVLENYCGTGQRKVSHMTAEVVAHRYLTELRLMEGEIMRALMGGYCEAIMRNGTNPFASSVGTSNNNSFSVLSGLDMNAAAVPIIDSRQTSCQSSASTSSSSSATNPINIDPSQWNSTLPTATLPELSPKTPKKTKRAYNRSPRTSYADRLPDPSLLGPCLLVRKTPKRTSSDESLRSSSADGGNSSERSSNGGAGKAPKVERSPRKEKPYSPRAPMMRKDLTRGEAAAIERAEREREATAAAAANVAVVTVEEATPTRATTATSMNPTTTFEYGRTTLSGPTDKDVIATPMPVAQYQSPADILQAIGAAVAPTSEAPQQQPTSSFEQQESSAIAGAGPTGGDGLFDWQGGGDSEQDKMFADLLASMGEAPVGEVAGEMDAWFAQNMG